MFNRPINNHQVTKSPSHEFPTFLHRASTVYNLPVASPHLHTPDARSLVDELLDEAVRLGASDIHLDPEAGDFAVRFRIDGLIRTIRRADAATGRAMVTRVMVMASLLTYRLDIPQEGRLTAACPSADRPLDLRVSVIPTTHGLRAVVRLPAELSQPRSLDALDLGPIVLDELRRFAAADAGLLLLTGPAGSGKTTTIYALLEHIAATQPGLSIVTLEDPVERDLPGVTQIEITPHGRLSYEAALRSVLRQDPQVLMLGEIRDAATASLAIQAALSGHRLIATLHAGSPATAVARLIEMGLEPYQITSALHAVVSQRLLRRCDGSGGYRGRIPIAEIAVMNPELRRAVLERPDAPALAALLGAQPGYRTLGAAAEALVAAGATDAAEIARVLGAGDRRA